MLSLRRAWRLRCLQWGFKRELSLAYSLHKPQMPEPDHAPLIILHGLFGSKQNNRSISKYGLSRPAFQVRFLIEAGRLHEISKRQCMHLSVFNMAEKDTHFANNRTGFKKPWRLTPRCGAQLFSDGRGCGGVHSAAQSAVANTDRTFNVGSRLFRKVWTKLKPSKGRKGSNECGTAISSTCGSFDTC